MAQTCPMPSTGDGRSTVPRKKPSAAKSRTPTWWEPH
jgi:hypothetical protein